MNSPTRLILIFSCLVLFALSGATRAEQVLVLSPSGQSGQGWLFGAHSQGKAACWIAAPDHVVSDSTGTPLPFSFLDRLNRQSEAATPIPVKKVAKALKATNNNPDLAFAPVVSGRTKDCLSRLGPAAYSLDVLLSQRPIVSLLSLTKTSHVRFDAMVTQTGIRAQGTLFDLRPIEPDRHAKLLGEGISGATAELLREEGPIPVAMILGKGAEAGTSRALRFDRIREAFVHVAAHHDRKMRKQRAATAGIPYNIRSVDLISLTKGITSSSLKVPGQCWRITPRGGRSDIQITIELSDPQDRIENLALIGKPDCGASRQAHAGIDVRRSDKDNWYRHISCPIAQSEAEAACRIGLTGPGQLRLSISTKTPVWLSGLVLR